MPGIYQYDLEIKSNVEKLLKDMKQVQDRLDTVEGREYTIKFNIDEKKLSNVISNLEKMLDSLGKGTGDFKQFENLSKELSSIVSEVQSLSKAFGKVDDSGAKTLLSSIQNIDKSLSELSQNILNVNKNMRNMGGNTSGAVKQVENITNESKKAASALEDVAKAQEKVNGQKTNISSGSNPTPEVSQNNNISDSIQKKKEALASYELQLEETRYEVEKLSNAESKLPYGFNRTYNDEKTASMRDRVTDIVLGNNSSSSERSGSKKWYALGNLANIDASALKTYQMWQEELQKVGYTLSEIRDTSVGLTADIIPIDGKAITNAEEFRKTLDSITTLPSKNVQLLNQQITELESKISSLKSEIASLGSPASNQTKDAFPKTSENLEQVAQSEQKVQQEAVATDNALDNISFTPNTEGFDDIIAKFGILREQAEQITKIVKTTKQTADGTPNISYKATLRNGSSYYLGDNSTPQVLNASETVYDAKADNAKKLERGKQIWNELTTSLERYATIQKRIASNNALSTDNEEAIKLLEHIHELQRNDILPTEKLTVSNEKLQQINQTVTDLKEKLKESTLDSLQGSIDKYQKIYDQRKTYSSDFTPSEQYTKNLTELNTAIGNLVEYRNTLKNVSEVTVEQEAELKGLVTACEKASDSFKSLSASEKGASQIAIDKLVQRINKDLDECTNYSKEAKFGLRALRDELESANPRNLKEITSEIINIENAEIRAGRAARSFFDTLKNSGFHQIAAQMAGMFGLYDVINVIKQAASTVIELNTQITELAKVSEQSSSQIYADFDSYADIAKEVRGTISDTIAATADWSKNGYSIPDAKKLAEVSQLYKNVGDGIDINTANESLISTLKGFQLEADQAEHIVDVFNEVSNNEAISSGGIGEALQRSAASFNAASTSLEKSVSLVTATNSVLQDPEKVGKQILAYLYSNVMKIKVAISVKPLRRARPRKDYNV